MADSGKEKEKSSFWGALHRQGSGKSKKAVKDTPGAAQSTATGAQPQGKQNSKQKKKEKSKDKKRKSSAARSPESSVDSPLYGSYGSVRDSFILQSPSAVEEDRLQQGSPPDGESAFVQNLSLAIRGELFPDDPETVEDKNQFAAEPDVKRKPAQDESSPVEFLEQIQLQLQGKEKEFDQDSSNKSLPDRLHVLFCCYEEKYKRKQMDLSRAHEKVRQEMTKRLKELESKEEQHDKDAAQMREDSKALEEMLQKEKETVKKLKSDVDAATKIHEEKETKARKELEEVRREIEQIETQLKERERELLKTLENLQQQHHDLENEMQQMKEEAQGKVREVLEKERLVSDKEEEIRNLKDQVAELKLKCETKITNMESFKEHSQERIIKSYEEKLKKLQQRLQRENEKFEGTTATTSKEERHDALQFKKKEEEFERKVREQKARREYDLMKKDEELEDLRQQLQMQEKKREKELKEREQQLQEAQEKLEKEEVKWKTKKDDEVEVLQRKFQEQFQTLEAKRKKELKELEQQLQATQEQRENELQQQLQAVKELLQEQESKREKSQRKLELLQKTMKAEASTAKSEEYLDEYFENVTRLCEELSDAKKKLEDQLKELEKLKKLVKTAEEMEGAYIETATRLSEAETNAQCVQTSAPVEGNRGEQSSGKGATGITAQPAAGLEVQSGSSVKKLNKEVCDLKEKLKARDEELRALKSKQDNTPLANPPVSPTDSMAADTREVASLKMQLREKQTELQNLQMQVSSTADFLKEREELKKAMGSLQSEVDKLAREKKTITEYSKKQSEKVLTLKDELQRTQEHVADQTHTNAESVQRDLQATKAKVNQLTRELDVSRKECSRKDAAFDVANEQAQHLQQKLMDEVKTLKETAERMKVTFLTIIEENKTLKRSVANMEKEKASAVVDAIASATAVHQEVETLNQEKERLKEESLQKDLIMQETVREQNKLEEKLTSAEAKCKELRECNQDVMQTVLRENEESKAELEKLKEEVKVKTAQVTQYKKQLQGKEPTEEVETLQVELATSRSSLEDAEKRFQGLSVKHAEMEKQYEKKFQEMEKQLQAMKAENHRMVKESETRQKLVEKQKELQLNQAQLQQVEMATELTRLQRARNREDEFSKAFHEEFEAHRVMKAGYAELENQLDRALDSLDGMKQKQEVLIQALVEHRVEVPFVETEPLLQANVPQATTETLQWTTRPPTAVAISQKPIASPGVFNQGVDRVSYMPPHSNAESQYEEQQAEQRVNHWQQQQLQQQQHMHQDGAAPPLSPQPRAALTVPGSQQAAMYNTETTVGLPTSQPVAPHSHLLSHATHGQWHSDSEIQSVRTVSGQPLSPCSKYDPNLRHPQNMGGVSGMGQNQPQRGGHPQLGPGLRGHSQPNVYVGQQRQAGVVMGQSQTPNPDRGHQLQHPNRQPAQIVSRGEPEPQNLPHVGHPGGNFLPENQPQNHKAMEIVGQHDPYPQQQPHATSNAQIQHDPYPQQQQPHATSNAQIQHGQQQPHAQIQHDPYRQQQPHAQHDPCRQQQLHATNAQAPSRCSPMIPAQGHQPGQLMHSHPCPSQHKPPLVSQPYNAPLPGEHMHGLAPPGQVSQYPQEDFVKPVPETILHPQACPGVSPSTDPVAGSKPKPSQPKASNIPPTQDDDKQGLMENLNTTIKETFEEINEEDPTPSIQSGLQSLPPDPNLVCVLCRRVFKIGQIQNFKRHSETCTGTQSK